MVQALQCPETLTPNQGQMETGTKMSRATSICMMLSFNELIVLAKRSSGKEHQSFSIYIARRTTMVYPRPHGEGKHVELYTDDEGLLSHYLG